MSFIQDGLLEHGLSQSGGFIRLTAPRVSFAQIESSSLLHHEPYPWKFIRLNRHTFDVN